MQKNQSEQHRGSGTANVGNKHERSIEAARIILTLKEKKALLNSKLDKHANILNSNNERKSIESLKSQVH